MLKTLEGETLELAPWRMRRFVRLLADARHYPAGTPPHVLIQDLRQLLQRARRVSSQPRTGTTRLSSTLACCNACLLARQRPRDGALTLLGLRIEPAPDAGWDGREFEFESTPKTVRIDLQWRYWPTLVAAVANTRGPGVYILGRGGRPVYVGESVSVAQRLAQHLWCAERRRDIGLAVWAASVPPTSLAAVEHALVRALRERGADMQRQRPLTVGAGGLSITHLLPDELTSRHAPANPPARPAARGFEWSS